MGNFLPEYFVGGTGGGAIGGLFIHDLVGLFVTPIGWGLMYYFVPIMLKKPIWSHGLSLVGFWGLAFFYPLTGIHHFLYTPIPMFLQYGAVISTIAVEFVVTTVIVNFFGTLWGRTEDTLRNLPIRWFYTGIIFYFITCLQCAFQVTLTFQKIIHFTDWVVGHAHLVMFGVFGFWIFGIMTYLFPRLLGRAWYSERLCEWHYWCSTIGLLVMFVDLTIAGVFQGFSWASLELWDRSVQLSMPFWWVRIVAGLGIIAGQVCFFVNIYRTYRLATPVGRIAERRPSAKVVTRSPRLVRNRHGQDCEGTTMFERKSGILLIAGLGFFALAFLSNGLVPWLMYSKFPEQTVEDTIEKQLTIADADKITDLDKLKVHRVNVVIAVQAAGADSITSRSSKHYGDDWQEMDRTTSGNNRRPTPSATAARSTSPRAAGIATASSSGRCRTRIEPLGPGVEELGVSERTAAAGDVRHAPRRAGPEPRGRPSLERLACGPLLTGRATRRPSR